MSDRIINHLTKLALFLPFSCKERRQRPASRCKAEKLEVIEKTEKTGLYGCFANAYISLQRRVSEGSGPGGRWFESTVVAAYAWSNRRLGARHLIQ